MARKLYDMIQVLIAEQDLDELIEALEGEEASGNWLELFRRPGFSFEEMLHALDGSDVERVRQTLGEVLIQGLGYDRNDVYALLYGEGQRIVWH